MTAFTNSSDSELYVYESQDATNFELLGANAYRPPAGLVRDPSLLRHTDGSYYITYTTAGDGHTIGFARSTDRINWTHVSDYPVPVPKAEAAWAPKWFTHMSGFVGVLVSISQGHGFTPYLMIANDPAHPIWSPGGAGGGAAWGGAGAAGARRPRPRAPPPRRRPPRATAGRTAAAARNRFGHTGCAQRGHRSRARGLL
ncbi:hypothetical protein ACFXO7_28235, partial [Nocardia tengchongensis]